MLHTVRNERFCQHLSLHELAELLALRRFVRVYRSATVNIESILQLDTMPKKKFEEFAVLESFAQEFP